MVGGESVLISGYNTAGEEDSLVLTRWPLVYVHITLVTPDFPMTLPTAIQVSSFPFLPFTYNFFEAGLVSEGGLETLDVNLVRCMGGPWSDHFTVLGCSEFRAKTNPMK